MATMEMPRRIRLAPEYGTWPLWDARTGDCLDPAELPLSRALAERITAWDDAFQATLDQHYPPDSRFPDAAAERAYAAEGAAIAAELRRLFGEDAVDVRLPPPSRSIRAAGTPT